jgi:hypothetical protein
MRLGNNEEEYVRGRVEEAGREAADRFDDVLSKSVEAFRKAHDEVHRVQGMKLSRFVAAFDDYLMDDVAVLLACVTAQGRRLSAIIAADVLHRAQATVRDRFYALEQRGVATSSHKGIRRYFSATDELMQLWRSSGCPTHGGNRGCQVCGYFTEDAVHYCTICGSDLHWKPSLQEGHEVETSARRDKAWKTASENQDG